LYFSDGSFLKSTYSFCSNSSYSVVKATATESLLMSFILEISKQIGDGENIVRD